MIGSLSSGLRGHQKARKPRGWNPPRGAIVESPVLIGLKNLMKLLYENAKQHWILFCLLTDNIAWNQVRIIL